jgi:hypothetical protein
MVGARSAAPSASAAPRSVHRFADWREDIHEGADDTDDEERHQIERLILFD